MKPSGKRLVIRNLAKIGQIGHKKGRVNRAVLVVVSQARLERVWNFTVGSAESATSSIFIVGGLIEINVLILHCRKASLNKLLAH